MITRLTVLSPERFDRLRKSHYARRMLSNFSAYETGYEFCAFYEFQTEALAGIINIFNATMTAEVDALADLSAITEAEIAELTQFILLNNPATVEADKQLALRVLEALGGLYKAEERTEFEFVERGEAAEMAVDELPPLETVFSILKTGFPAIAQAHGLWLTDTSHRIRRGLAQAFVYDGCTTATIQYIVHGVVLVGHVATLPEFRGTLHARRLLYRIGGKLAAEGFRVRLFARAHRVSYYEEIGFRAIGQDIVLEPVCGAGG
ncbi:MAG: hypothetical protein QM689_11120 [Oscillospiraceae bacterium]